jgi:hypothetical protein
MTREEAVVQIEQEFSRAREAQQIGNEGKARACARRAAGAAVRFWLQNHATKGWGLDCMNQLESISGDDEIPEEVRGAATRLSTKITERSTAPFTPDPVSDGAILTEYFLQ